MTAKTWAGIFLRVRWNMVANWPKNVSLSHPIWIINTPAAMEIEIEVRLLINPLLSVAISSFFPKTEARAGPSVRMVIMCCGSVRLSMIILFSKMWKQCAFKTIMPLK